MHAMLKSQNERYDSAAALAQALQSVQDQIA